MKQLKILAVLGMVGGLLSGCGSLPVMEMTKTDYVKAPVYVADISFEKFKRPAKWETDAEWNKHVEAWQKQFWEKFTDRFPQARKLTSDAKTGLIVRPYVTDISRNYIQMVGGADTTTLHVELLDAASNQHIGQINYLTDSSDAGWASLTFGGRIAECVKVAGIKLGKILKKNQ